MVFTKQDVNAHNFQSLQETNIEKNPLKRDNYMTKQITSKSYKESKIKLLKIQIGDVSKGRKLLAKMGII